MEPGDDDPENDALRERLTELFDDSPCNDAPLTDEQKAAVDRAMGRDVPPPSQSDH